LSDTNGSEIRRVIKKVSVTRSSAIREVGSTKFFEHLSNEACHAIGYGAISIAGDGKPCLLDRILIPFDFTVTTVQRSVKLLYIARVG
jgi:hypothetical protein